MPVNIKRVSVQNLGPINDLQIDLESFNLIYGKNERGKTFLVEFIIQSLFKYADKWQLRGISANGKVEVMGLNDDVIAFSPSSSIKIEDFLKESHEFMPSTISKLLVVKGAESKLVENIPGGVNRTIVREYLSSESLLDKIQKDIPKTIRDAIIREYSIDGANRGDIKTIRNLDFDLRIIDELFENINEEYSNGYRVALNHQLELIDEKISKQNNAKRFKAQQLALNIEELEIEKEKLTWENINKLRNNNNEYITISETIDRKTNEYNDLEADSENYEWLEIAIPEYKERVRDISIQSKYLLSYIAAFLAIISLAFFIAVLFGWVTQTVGILIGIFFAVAAVILAGFYFRQQTEILQRSFDFFEEQHLSEEFESRFNDSLKSIASMETLLNKLQQNHTRRQVLKDDIKEEEARLGESRVKIRQGFDQVGEKWGEEGPWNEDIEDMAMELNKNEQRIQEIVLELKGLNIDPSEYLNDSPNVDYDYKILDSLIEERNIINEKLYEETTKLENLKHRICDKTADEISVDWEILIQNLRLRWEEVKEEYKDTTAKVIAQITVNEEIEKIRERQDTHIKEILCSEVISDPLFQLTGKYEEIDLLGDILVVSNPYATFPVSELSTGAQEQVLLALRMGCATKIAKKDSLFMILDDAFQHADWDRRVNLIDELISMAKSGWQIISLTMDDHIKDIFYKRGTKEFGKEMVFVNLEEL